MHIAQQMQLAEVSLAYQEHRHQSSPICPQPVVLQLVAVLDLFKKIAGVLSLRSVSGAL